jgi:predicted transcriptional regulator
MRKAVIQIRKDDDAVLDEMANRFTSAWKTGKSENDVFTFNSPAQLFSVISPKRWELIEKLQATGPSSIRALARALDRDVKRVHEDCMAMMDWGLLERNDAGQVLVPYELIHADFNMSAAA